MNNFETLAKSLEQESMLLVSEITYGLRQLTDLISKSINVGSGTLRIESNLSDEELYALVLRIPAECIYVQEQADKISLGVTLQSILTDSDISESTQLLQGTKGDAKERQRRAEAMSSDKLLKDAARRQVVRALSSCVERADKMYEGVKKIIDAKSREFNLSGKLS